MDFELPHIAQRRIQAKRMARLFPDPVEDDEEEEGSILFSIASDEDGDAEDDEEGIAAVVLLGGGRGRRGTGAAWWPTSQPRLLPNPARPVERLVRLVNKV